MDDSVMDGTYYTEAELRANDGTSPFDDKRTTINQKGRFQDLAASNENRGRGGSKMQWLGLWVNDVLYEVNDVVREGDWTMVANKQTSDRPAPQPTGSPYWASGLGDTPTWTPNQKTEQQVLRGQRYTFPEPGYITNARIWQENPAQSYRYGTVVDPLGTPAMEISPELGTGQTGWLTINPGTIIIRKDTVLDFLKIIENKATSTNYSGNWNYQTPQQETAADLGVISHSVRLAEEMWVSKTDSDGGDRAADLANVQIGDRIIGATINWEVLGINDAGSYIAFNVSPQAYMPVEGIQSFTFETYGAQPIDYVYIPNHFAGSTTVDGLWSDTGYNNIALTDHAYGVDLQVQNAYISPDWDIIAYSGN